MIDVKRAVQENRKVKFSYAHAEQLWYETEFGEKFPVPFSGMGQATFLSEDKAIFSCGTCGNGIRLTHSSIAYMCVVSSGDLW